MDRIEQPMDLGTIGEQLSVGQYTEPADFIADMTLVFNNSFCYNSKNSRVQNAAAQNVDLCRAYRRTVGQMLK